jgi:hypothetical protein
LAAPRFLEILIGMHDMLRNFTVSRVAGGDPDGAMAWLQRRTAWEDRLRNLERDHGPAVDREQEAAGPVRTVVSQRAGR